MGNQLLKTNKPPKSKGGQNHANNSKDGGLVILRNKHSKKNGRRGNSSDFKARRDKHKSCPEFSDGGAIPYETTYSVGSVHDISADTSNGTGGDNDVKVEIKIYRSYGDLDRYRQELVRDQSNPDIRVYKRSSSSIAAMSSTASLPKDFAIKKQRKHHARHLLNGDVGNSPARAEVGDDGVDGGVNDVLSDSRDDEQDVGGAGGSRVSHEQKLSPQHRSAPNISVRKQMSLRFRFPRTSEVKRKLKVFEDRFRKALTFKFLSLEEGRLLDTLCMARDLDNQEAEVSVRQFLLGRGLPEHLPADHYVLLVPAAIYKLLSHVRQDGVTDKKLWRSLGRDILTACGEEVSRELSRMYEYQIVMLQEDVSIQLLAQHAVDCVMEYVIRKRALLHRNTVLRAVLTAAPRRSSGVPVRFSVMIGDREQKWDLFDVLKKPGVRKDIYYKDSDGLALGMDSPFPWRFFASDNNGECDPAVYGYRGQMLEYDYVNEVYRMYPEDKLYADELSFSRDDYHMHYVPYKVLVNVDIMREYLEHILANELPNRPNVSLTDYYKHAVPYQGDERQQQMVYRPLAQLGSGHTWRGAVLENMDLTRVNLSDHPGECQSLHGSVLLYADCRDATVCKTDVEGCDFSYAIIGGRTLLPAAPATSGHVTQLVLLEDKDQRMDLILDTEGNRQPPAEVIALRMKTLTDISPEKDSFSSLDYNFNIPTTTNKTTSGKPPLSHDASASKRRHSSNASATNKRKPPAKQRRVVATITASHQPPAHAPPPPVRPPPPTGSTPAHSVHSGASSRSSPCRSIDALTSSSDALDRGEIIFADAGGDTPIKQQRAEVPVLMFPPPPAYSPDKQSSTASRHDESMYSASSPTSFTSTPPHSTASCHSPHQMSIESQVEAIMTSPIYSQPHPKRGSHTTPRVHLNNSTSSAPPAGRVRRPPPRTFKKPIRKRAVLKSIEESPGAVLLAKLTFHQAALYGREEEVNDISDAIIMNTRLVTITGCPGLGKSALAIAVARRLYESKQFLPVFVDLRGCLTADQVRAKIVHALGLKLTRQYFDLVGHWLGCHNQKILLLLDNIDLPYSELDAFSDLLPALLHSQKVFMLATSRSAIYGGDYGVTDYKLGDIEEASCDMLRNMVPDLPDSCVQELASVCGYVPYTVGLVGSALKHPDISAQHLYQSLVALGHHVPDLSKAAREQLAPLCADEDVPLVCRLFAVVDTVVQHMPSEVRKLLNCLSLFHGPFDRPAARAVMTEPSLEARLPDFPYTACTCYGGLLDKDPSGELLVVPHLVSAVMQANTTASSNSNRSSAEFKYYTYYINKVTRLCQCYHSRDYEQGLTGIWNDYENILDALKKAMYDSRELYESCARLATPDMCIFLYEALEESDYLDLYQCLMDVTKQWVDCNVDRCVLCCFAYFHLRGENFTEASSLVDEAMELFPKASPTTDPLSEQEVFAIMLMLYRGVLDWRMEYDEDDEEAKETRETAIDKVRRALEALKQMLGLQHALTIYAYETYALLEKDRGNFQKSRHFYNVLDFVGDNILGRHPALLDGYDARRAIWERQGLFCRATDVAQRAAQVALTYHGEHPFTAELHMKWVDCLLKVGDVPEASRAADVALSMRERLFGDHIETVLAHKMVAYLNLRCCLYDEAVKHGQKALEMSRRLRVHTAYLSDIETILTQAERRKMAADKAALETNNNNNKDTEQRHTVAQVHSKSLHVPRTATTSNRPQKPLRSTLSTSACRAEAAIPLHHQTVRASLSTAV